ncbi:MAG TPA: PDZ domain-containing protein [Planctomycetaceae bacterium]|nr:PDZ domain-containing protein [Planctomycetaceae bacterium]
MASLALCQEETVAQRASPSARQLVAAIETVVADAIQRAERSVVAIARERQDVAGADFRFEFRPDPFGGRVLGVPESKPTDPDFIPREFASGVVIDSRGLILTAYHVLEEGCRYFVTTADRNVFEAWVKAADPRSDLAVLAVNRTDLVPIELGDAERLRKGQFVIALGNPYALARDGRASASWGIVANLARKTPPLPTPGGGPGKTTLHHFGTLIQTDAKLNLGTSGGPLVDLDGRMIGLCVSLAALTGYEQAAGYAIPVDGMFRRALEALKEGREVEYGLLGIGPANLTGEERQRGLYGSRVSRVWPGTPAERYGLRAGDIITAINDQPIYDADTLMLAVGRQPVGARVRLRVLRDGQPNELAVVLTKYPVKGRKVVSAPRPAWRGIEVDYPTGVLDPIQWGVLETPLLNYDDGVMVTKVEENSPAWRAGLRPHHVISHVAGVRVRTPEEFQKAVAGRNGPVECRLTAPQGRTRVITVPPEA